MMKRFIQFVFIQGVIFGFVRLSVGQELLIKEVPDTKAWAAKYAVVTSTLMEICMQTLEKKDIFITAYDMDKRIIETEYKLIDPGKAQSLIKMYLEPSSFDKYKYRYTLSINPESGQSVVQAKTTIKAYGRPIKIMGARPGWYTIPSNGNLEKEILEAMHRRIK